MGVIRGMHAAIFLVIFFVLLFFVIIPKIIEYFSEKKTLNIDGAEDEKELAENSKGD